MIKITLAKIEPFVRQVCVASLGSDARYEVFHELQTPDCRLFYITSGNGSMLIDGVQYRLTPSSVVLMRAGTRYMWQPDVGCRIGFVAVNFDYTHSYSHIKKSFHPIHSADFREANILERGHISDAELLDGTVVTENIGAAPLFDALAAEFCIDGDYRDEVTTSLLRAIICLIVRCERERNTTSGKKGSTLVRALIQYIQNNYRNSITNETIAAELHFNSAYLNRVFKAHTGTSLHAFLVKYRLNAAIDLLRTGNMPISEIALSVGFSDPAHFTKSFKAYTGYTPTEFVGTV